MKIPLDDQKKPKSASEVVDLLLNADIQFSFQKVTNKTGRLGKT